MNNILIPLLDAMTTMDGKRLRGGKEAKTDWRMGKSKDILEEERKDR